MQPLIIVLFYKLIQNSQKLGSNNEHMFSEVFFQADGKNYSTKLRQPYGGDHAFESDPIEVELPKELKEIVKYDQFRRAAEDFYRALIGANGGGINIQGGENIVMYDNHFDQSRNPFYATMERVVTSGGGW